MTPDANGWKALALLIDRMDRAAAVELGWRIARAADDPADRSNLAALGRMVRALSAAGPALVYDPDLPASNSALIGAIVCGMVPPP